MARRPVELRAVDHPHVVREALLETILDSAEPLQANGLDWLFVVALPLARETAQPKRYRLYLNVKGADLSRLTDKRMPRDAARKLVSIVEQP